MLFSRINKVDPEKVFIVVQAGEALLQGRPVCYHWTGTSDGKIGWLADEATDQQTVVGLADAAIASGAYGLVQCYGYRSDGQVMLSTTIALNNGAALNIASVSSGCLSCAVTIAAAGGAFLPFVLAASATMASTATPAAMGVFIRCM